MARLSPGPLAVYPEPVHPPSHRARALGGLLTLVALLTACGSPAPSEPSSSSTSTEETTGAQGAKGARALVRDPDAAEWQLVPSPERAFTTAGRLTPAPATATKDGGIGYDRECQVRPRTTTVPDDPCLVGDPQGDTEVVLVGDSKMLQWLSAIDPIAEAEGWRVTVLTKSACGLTQSGQYDECLTYNRAVVRHLTSADHVPALVLTSLGDYSSAELTRGLAANLGRLESAGARVVPIADNPAPDKEKGKGSPGPVLTCVRAHPEDWSSCAYPRNDGRGTESLEDAARQVDGAEVVNVNRWICPTEKCPAAIGGVLVYRQGTHLTATYVRSLAPALHRALIDAGHASADPLS